MIRIRRPDEGPGSLRRWGGKQTRLDCDAYDDCPGDYQSGRVTFPQRKYYSARTVKDLLVKMHHSKCCYCEKRFRSRAYLHVEHFRPKCGVRQDPGQKTNEPPGYYWLSYRWDNLLLSCHDCNSIYKRTLFPLANPVERARSHHDDLARERPLFIDPVADDPRDHIRFDGDLPLRITPEGRTTIEGIGLRRTELREDRLESLRHIEARHDFLELAATRSDDADFQAKVKEARKFIDAAMQPDSEFSSMVKDYIARLGL